MNTVTLSNLDPKTQERMRRTLWQHTNSGGVFWPSDPRPQDINIQDIAHHLSLLCRFNGAVREFYSVAQHSVLVMRVCRDFGCGPEMQLKALLHDAAEAYVGDCISPIKKQIRQFGEWEARIQCAIHEALNIQCPDDAEREAIREADHIILETEMRDLLPHRKVFSDFQPIPERIKPMTWKSAKALFLKEYARLTKVGADHE